MLFRLLLLPITLPFTLLGSLMGLFGLSTRILLFPLKIFARHTVACLIIAALVILYLAIKKDPRSLDQLKPAPAPGNQSQQVKGAPPIIEPVAKRENGDSKFATDLYASMTDPERQQYSNYFYAAMRTASDGKPYAWQYYNIHGSLTPTGTFKNNLGETCRSFTEVLKVHRIEQTLTGTACDNGGGTWCKLKPNATPQCGLSPERGAFDGLTNSIKSLF